VEDRREHEAQAPVLGLHLLSLNVVLGGCQARIAQPIDSIAASVARITGEVLAL